MAVTTKQEYITKIRSLMDEGHYPNSEYVVTTMWNETQEGGVLTLEEVASAATEALKTNISVAMLESQMQKYNLS